MNWSDVGEWLKKNSGGLLGLAGAVATGNIPAGVAAVAAMISEATGKTDPVEALKTLQLDPESRIRLEELVKKDEADIRLHYREVLKLELEDRQKEQEEQQKTIRTGDTAEDPYVRKTRPLMARQSWYATMVYVIGMELLKGFSVVSTGASWDLAMILVAPAGAYLGFRSWDKKNGVVSIFSKASKAG